MSHEIHHHLLHRANEIELKHIEGRNAETPNSELFVEVMREQFEIAADDDAGIEIDLRNDFLFSGVNAALKNLATG